MHDGEQSECWQGPL